jgi:hypothetical protein
MPSYVTNLEALVAHSMARQKIFVRSSVFSAMTERRTLEDARQRNVILACARRFSTNFQTLLFTRQALCVDPKFQPTFLRHLTEEIGHDKLLAADDMPAPIDDAVFEAIVTWFSYQMVVLDNVERTALMHLVLEVAGDHFHAVAAPYLREKVRSGYFDVHAELDAGHANMGVELLDGLGPATYQRLAGIVDRGWDMMEATFERVSQLIEAPQ